MSRKPYCVAAAILDVTFKSSKNINFAQNENKRSDSSKYKTCF